MLEDDNPEKMDDDVLPHFGAPATEKPGVKISPITFVFAIGVVLVLPILTGLLPDQWFYNHFNAYLPQQAGSVVYQVHPTGTQLLSAWEGFGVLCIWTVLLLAIATYLLDRRDA